MLKLLQQFVTLDSHHTQKLKYTDVEGLLYRLAAVARLQARLKPVIALVSLKHCKPRSAMDSLSHGGGIADA